MYHWVHIITLPAAIAVNIPLSVGIPGTRQGVSLTSRPRAVPQYQTAPPESSAREKQPPAAT